MGYRKATLPHQMIGDDLLVVAPRRQTVHLLNGVGAFIWKNIDASGDIDAVARRLCETFDCDIDRARRDADDYVDRLLRAGLLIADDAPAAGDTVAATPVTIPDGGCSLSSLLPEAQAKAYDACIPLNAIMELTLACNVKCPHCYNMDRAASRTPTSLTTEEIKGILRQLREAGTLFLTLTGGEIFARRDIFEILDEVERLAMTANLLTNGSLIDEAVARRLAGYQNIWGASVSIYGGDGPTGDRVTKVPGSFDRTMSGIRHLTEQGIPVSLKFVIMTENVESVPAMMRLAERTGLPYTVDTLVTPRNDGSRETVGLRIDAAKLEALYRGPLRHLLPSIRAVEEGQFDFMCNCARAMCAVMANGDVFPCISVPLKAGNLREQSFREIWDRSPVFARIRGLNPADFAKCHDCIHKYYCRRDKGNALTVSGEYTGVDEWVCGESEIIRDVVLGTARA